MVKTKCILYVFLTIILAVGKIQGQTCGNSNVALNKSVTVSAAGSGAGTVPASVTDGIISNTWQPVYSADNFAQIDLGSSKTVCRVKVNWGRYNAASAFKVQMTNTPTVGTSWVDIANVTNNNPTVGNETGSNYYDWYVYNNLNITVTGNIGRYIRIWVGSLSNPNWFISEVEVYEQTASNSVPGCSFTAPTANITIAAGTAYTLKANASDPDPGGSISEVGFYSGTSSTAITNLLNDPPQTQAPYEYTWTPTTPGTYFLQAKAKDNVGAIGSSGIIQVTVTPPNIGWGLLGNTVTSANSVTNAFLGTTNAEPFIVKTADIERYRVTETGKMLIGSTQLAAGAPANTLLTVNGYIMSKGLKITQLAANWPDYVFEKNYELMPLPTLEEFIKRNKHLPGVPSDIDVQNNGLSVGENQALLLKKIEELTLYIIELEKRISVQEAKSRNTIEDKH